MMTQPRCAGFTLVELVLVVALLALLQLLAGPSLASLESSMRLTTATNSLFSSLILARSEAIKRNSRVVVCKSANPNACSTSGGWEQGWIVFHDTNNNAVRDLGEEVLLHEQALAQSIRLVGNGPVSSYVSYTSMGTTSYPSGAFQAGTFTVCSKLTSGGSAREIKISSAGRPRTTRTTVDHCV